MRRYNRELGGEQSAMRIRDYGELSMSGEELEVELDRLDRLAWVERTYCLWCWRFIHGNNSCYCHSCWERFIHGLRPPWQPDGVARRASQVKLGLGIAMAVVAELIAFCEMMWTDA